MLLYTHARVLVVRFFLFLNILCRPTGVLPAVPPIPKAPGTLLPSFDSPPALQPDTVDDSSSRNQRDSADDERCF